MIRDIKLVNLSINSDLYYYNYNICGEAITGIQNLVQKIAKIILTKKGSNLYNSTTYGSSFYDLLGAHTNNEIEEVKELVPVILVDLVKQIKESQNNEILNGAIYEPDELLENIILEDIEYDELFNGWVIKLSIESQSGQAQVLTIT